jgi:hypothetical protein
VEVVEADYREVVQSQEQLILAVEAEVLETLIVMVQQVAVVLLLFVMQIHLLLQQQQPAHLQLQQQVGTEFISGPVQVQ